MFSATLGFVFRGIAVTKIIRLFNTFRGRRVVLAQVNGVFRKGTFGQIEFGSDLGYHQTGKLSSQMGTGAHILQADTVSAAKLRQPFFKNLRQPDVVVPNRKGRRVRNRSASCIQNVSEPNAETETSCRADQVHQTSNSSRIHWCRHGISRRRLEPVLNGPQIGMDAIDLEEVQVAIMSDKVGHLLDRWFWRCRLGLKFRVVHGIHLASCGRTPLMWVCPVQCGLGGCGKSSMAHEATDARIQLVTSIRTDLLIDCLA